MHDDLIDHPISVSPECWQILKRVVAFLGTDLELAGGRPRPPLPEFWPFRDASEWLANEPSDSDRQIPEYDAEIYGRPVRPAWDRIPTLGGLLIAGVLVVFALIMAIIVAGR
jgi:hypothetical protein